MKFEHLLKIYWARGLYFNGILFKLDWTLNEMFFNLVGFNQHLKLNFIKRFELDFHLKNKKKTIFSFSHISIEDRKLINMYISQLTNTHNSVNELIKYTLIRLYLIKSYRGRAHMLGKPVHGQRTWSNAWTAYKNNKLIKNFVNEVIKNNNIKKEVKQLNLKIVKRKLRKHRIKIKMQQTVIKKDLWF